MLEGESISWRGSLLCFDFDSPVDGGDFHRNKGKKCVLNTLFSYLENCANLYTDVSFNYY